MGGWLFLIGISILIMAPIYWVVMRPFSEIQKVYVFTGVAVVSTAVCFMILHDDPRLVSGTGYLLIFVVGPFTVGWIGWGLISLMRWSISAKKAN